MRYLIMTYIALFAFKAFAETSKSTTSKNTTSAMSDDSWEGIASVQEATKKATAVGKTVEMKTTTTAPADAETEDSSQLSSTSKSSSSSTTSGTSESRGTSSTSYSQSTASTSGGTREFSGDEYDANAQCCVKYCESLGPLLYSKCIGECPPRIAAKQFTRGEGAQFCAEVAQKAGYADAASQFAAFAGNSGSGGPIGLVSGAPNGRQLTPEELMVLMYLLRLRPEGIAALEAALSGAQP